MAALKALVQEKGQKSNPDNGEIPPLCSCGAMLENVNAIKRKQAGNADEYGLHMCANNC